MFDVIPSTLLVNTLAGENSSEYFIQVFCDNPDSVSLSISGAWLSLKSSKTYSGLAMFSLKAQSNTGQERSTQIRIMENGVSKKEVVAKQDSGQTLYDQEIQVGQSAKPLVGLMVIEMAILGEFIAQLIKKIPLPYRLIAIGIIIVLINALAVVITAGRQAINPIVPAPDYVFKGDVQLKELYTLPLSVTGNVIENQGIMLGNFVAEKSLE